MANYYDILGVSKDAGKDEIKSAFRKKAREYHPDINKEANAEAKFKELGKAYETLMDDEKRSLYDRYGEDGLSNAGYAGGGPFEHGFGDINDIFNTFFGGGFGGFGGFSQRQVDPNAPQRGDDLRVDIQIDFEQAVFGCEKEVKIDHLETCEACKGSGAEPGSKPTTCQTCGGSGQVRQTTQTILGSFTQVTTCPDCKGSGQTISNKCKACKGYGKVEREKTIDLKIPAGVDNQSKMRLSAEGDAGKNGGPAGDLYVVIHVKKSDYYTRDGVDVYTKLEISPPQAALGDEIEIKTLDGTREIHVSSGVQNGDKIKLKGLGIPYLNKKTQRGNHIVVITIKTPKHLSNEEKDLYKKLYALKLGKSHKKSEHKEGLIEKVKSAFK